MRTRIFRPVTLFILSLFAHAAYSQCQIATNASRTSITCGSCVTLSAFGNGTGNIAFEESFNTGAPVGWQFTQSAQFSNPCSPNGVDGTPHLWMGDASPNPRTMATIPLDLSLGGYICFDMLFAEQGDASPCEGPDEPQEGVYIQYSIDNGATWVTINYFDPNGGNDPQLTNWNNWCFTLPAAAVTANTMIRWHQDNVTDNTYDHWGIDNVQITLNDPNFGITWIHDGYEYGLGVPGGNNPTPVCPPVTTTYVAQVSDGTTTCLDSVTITVVDPVIIISAGADSTLCEGQCLTLDSDAYHLVSPASTPTFSNDEFGGAIGNSASINVNVQGLNMTSLFDGAITQVCINGFLVVGGVNVCTDFGGCPCNGGTINLGQQCPISATSYDLTLTSPDGCVIQLAPAGAATGNYDNTCFIPVGGTPIGPGFPTGGSWNPFAPFTGLNGCDPNGVWTLTFAGPNIPLGTTVVVFTGWNISFDDPEITEPVDFVWSPLTNMTGEDTFTPEVCPTETTTYTLSATDLAGCITVTDDVTITIETCCALEVIATTVVDPSCAGADGSITVSELAGELGAVTYALDGGVPQSSPTFSDLAVGSYIITVNDLNNCPVDVTVDLVAGDGPVINAIDIVAPSCGANDGEISVDATGNGLTYSLDGGLLFGSEPDSTGLASGVYNVVISDVNGCSLDTTLTLTPLDGPEILSIDGTTPLCGGSDGTITITGSPVVQDFSIDGGTSFQSDGLFTDLPPGTYDIVVSDAGGCTAIGNITLDNIPGPVIDDVITVDPLCGALDGSIEIQATGTGLLYSIDGGITTQVGSTFSGLAQGNYAIQVVDGVGCITDQVITLQSANGPVLDAVETTVSDCGLDDGTITITASGTGLTFSIDGGISFAAQSNFTDLAPGSYSIVVQDVDGCISSATAVVDELPGPTLIDVVTVAATCGTDDGSITIDASGTGLAYSIDGGTTYQVGNAFADLTPGDYTVVVQVSGCTEQQIVTVDEQSGPVITDVEIVQPACSGDANGSIVVSATGSGTLNYGLNGGTLQASPTFAGLAFGTYTIMVEATPGNCSFTQDVVLADPAPLVLQLVAADPACATDCDGTATAVINGGTGSPIFIWSGGIPVGTGAQATGLCGGDYALVVSDVNGCTVDTSFTLVAPAPFVIGSLITTNETCPGLCDGSISIIAVGGALYSLNGGIPQVAPVFTGLCPGAYSIQAVDANGCPADTSTAIIPAEELEAGFIPTPPRTNVYSPRFVFTNTSTGAVSYDWDFGGYGTSTDVSPGFVFPELADSISVCLTATNSIGCTDTYCGLVIIDPSTAVFVPNTFTPDADGINDQFFVVGDLANGKNFRLTIHDRWGEEIFNTNDMLEAWDGSYSGTPCQDGVYVWTVETQDPLNAEIRRMTGHVTLIR
jgi:gliding motility-associated-like protein